VITVGRGHSASSAAVIAAACSSLGAGVIEIAATLRPYRTRLQAAVEYATGQPISQELAALLARLDRDQRQAAQMPRGCRRVRAIGR